MIAQKFFPNGYPYKIYKGPHTNASIFVLWRQCGKGPFRSEECLVVNSPDTLEDITTESMTTVPLDELRTLWQTGFVSQSVSLH